MTSWNVNYSVELDIISSFKIVCCLFVWTRSKLIEANDLDTSGGHRARRKNICQNSAKPLKDLNVLCNSGDIHRWTIHRTKARWESVIFVKESQNRASMAITSSFLCDLVLVFFHYNMYSSTTQKITHTYYTLEYQYCKVVPSLIGLTIRWLVYNSIVCFDFFTSCVYMFNECKSDGGRERLVTGIEKGMEEKIKRKSKEMHSIIIHYLENLYVICL